MSGKRESIFGAFFRAFCRFFGGIVGLIFGLVALGVVLAIFSGASMAGKNQLVITADADGNRTLLPKSSPVILRINIHGEIGSRELNAKLIENQLLDAREGTLKNRVKAIMLHINSPGGTVSDSHNIYTSLLDYKEKYKVPIFAYVNGLCASGGMYVACSADQILSNPTGIIGSVGVRIGPLFNVSKLMERFDISQVTLIRGKDKDMGSPYRPLKEGEFTPLKAILDYDYEQFTKIVLDNRPHIDRDRLINVYGAQIYDPIKAQEIGYVDNGNANYSSALKQLAEEAEIEGKYQVVEIRTVPSLVSKLTEGKSTLFPSKIKHEFDIPGFKKEWMGVPLYLYSPALDDL